MSPYEIQSPLGAGGMGEVYRAHHARARVALKVLPEVFADDPERLAGFQREAKFGLRTAGLRPRDLTREVLKAVGKVPS